MQDTPDLCKILEQWLEGDNFAPVYTKYTIEEREVCSQDDQALGQEKKDEERLVCFAKSFINGDELPYEEICDTAAKRIALPTYPLDAKSYWVKSKSNCDLSPAKTINPESKTTLVEKTASKLRLKAPPSYLVEPSSNIASRIQLLPLNSIYSNDVNHLEKRITCTKKDRVYTISLSIGDTLDLDQMGLTIDQAEKDPEVCVILIRGLEAVRSFRGSSNLIQLFITSNLPIIVSLEEDTYHLGFSLAIHADFILASSQARISFDTNQKNLEKNS